MNKMQKTKLERCYNELFKYEIDKCGDLVLIRVISEIKKEIQQLKLQFNELMEKSKCKSK